MAERFSTTSQGLQPSDFGSKIGVGLRSPLYYYDTKAVSFTPKRHVSSSGPPWSVGTAYEPRLRMTFLPARNARTSVNLKQPQTLAP